MKIESPVETLLGAVVIATALGFAYYASQHAGAAVGGDSYDVSASFGRIGGIASGTDVRIAGVKVGSVSNVSLDPETYRATVTMAIRSDVEIPEDTIVAIDADGLLGGAYVALAPGASFDAIGPGGELENTQSSKSINDIIAQALDAMGRSNGE